MPLLGPNDCPPFDVQNADGTSEILFVSDHNGTAVPEALDGLGVPPAEMRRHVAYDIGIAAVAEILSARFNAPLVTANYSRLVIDCNRTPGTPASIPAVSDGTEVPANRDLTAAERKARESELFDPYHEAIENLVYRMIRAGRGPVLVALHSFTPVMEGVFRPWDIGLLYKDDERLARPVIERLSADGRICVGDNKPYSGRDPAGYSTGTHATKRGLLTVGVEFRQDRIEFAAGARLWADRFGDALASTLTERPWKERQAA